MPVVCGAIELCPEDVAAAGLMVGYLLGAAL